MGVRRRGRELALQILYQQELTSADIDQIILGFEDLQKAPPVARQFAEELARGVLLRREEIDQNLESQADNWRLVRMAIVDRNVLRLAMYELMFEGDVPAAVVIDEAVEIAKRFGSERSSQFINGLLDGFLHRSDGATG
jgi:N utilization substance protein B